MYLSLDPIMSTPSKFGVIATIVSRDSTKHVAWLKAVFDAEQKEIYHTKDKKHVMHCAMEVNNGCLYLCDSATSVDEKSLSEEEREAESRGMLLHVECKDPSVFWKNALANGATVIDDLKKQFWGAVYGRLRDPFGFVWGLMEGGECCKPGVIPYLMVTGCEAYLEWAEKAVGVVIKDKFMSDENQIQHCSLEVNGGVLYMAEDLSDTRGCDGDTIQSHVILHRDVANPTASWDQLKNNGASTVVNLEVQFWGDLYGTARDEKGFCWSLCKASTAPSPKNSGVLAYINSPDCKKHVEWIKAVFGGEVETMNKVESGEVVHCQMTVNGGTLMLSDRLDMTQPDKPTPLPEDSSSQEKDKNGEQCKFDQKGVTLHLSLDDPDSVWLRAMEKGGVKVVPLKNQYWGDYYGQFQDPFGYSWSIRKNTT